MKKVDNIRNIEKIIFCIVFFSGICVFSFFTAKPTLNRLKHLELCEAVQLKNVEKNVNKSLYKRNTMYESYAKLNYSLGKKEIDNFSYALDKKGYYHPVNFWVNVDSYNYRRFAQQILTLKKDIYDNGGKVVFMGIPNKYNEAWTKGYKGIPYNDYNKQLDELLLWNRRYGIDYVDFRETLKKSKIDYNKMFYKTDEYWSATASFLAFKDLVNYLNEEENANLDKSGYYRNIKNYEVKYYNNKFLGSYARRAGKSMIKGGLEDFETIAPKFKGNITFEGKTGDYKDTVLDESKLNYSSVYDSNVVGYYMSGIKKTQTIINNDNPKGLKILWLRDPAASPLIVDTIPLCSKIDCVWGKYATDGYIKKILKENKYDYVFISYETVNLVPEFFDFYKNDHPKIGDKAKSKAQSEKK
ncbi:alginate O-acetyltransferase AlgX-related protein [Lachnobacterium bovis]|uniref:AlgX/AlgJ SGNH hydrolase-like domain-containing protein n=1 Tax=Lachnobacterium bovis TaxID=140626 RepID=A0A1H9PWN7_9FIRM|nr:hypothetical protein [Lachnobacterium bovis]SER52538.1 hypothetical protein SAMN02910429_00342 [Lachnobacterium bovis]